MLAAFGVAVAAAFVYYLVAARRRWFSADEWYFIAGRTGGNLDDLFRPHNEHWSTLPVLAFRLLWQIAGLRYFPYLVLIVALHLTVACLLRIVMRRAGVNPWIATAAATLFVLFGTGHDDIVWAFQIGFVGALGFGLAHLLLADHDGPLDRRDSFGLVAGLAGLMCSGVGVPMVAVVGLAALVRRGWRVALFHVVPLAAIYCVWPATSAENSYSSGTDPGLIARFTASDLRATFDALGQVPGSAVILGALLVVGLAMAWSKRPRADIAARAAAPGALLVGAVVFLAITGIGRTSPTPGFFTQPWDASRYLYVVAALVIPALAVALDAIARRLGWLGTIAAAAVLLMGVPGNLATFDTYNADTVQNTLVFRHGVEAPTLAITRELPRSFLPFLPFVPFVTVGWLRDSAAAGRIPRPRPVGRRERSQLTLKMVLHPFSATSSDDQCRAIVGSGRLQLQRDDLIVVQPGGTLALAYVLGNRPMAPVRYGNSAYRTTLRTMTGPLPLQMTSSGDGVQLCRS